jgi:hypothetical protein
MRDADAASEACGRWWTEAAGNMRIGAQHALKN